MQRLLPLAAFAAGLATLAWVAAGQWPAHPGALLVTLLIAVVYLAGARELQRFRRETAWLDEVVAALPEDPDAPAPAGDAWLAPLPASLQAVVRARLDGVRGPLPGPAMAPAIAGLLVLLGMLGTFLGLIVTFRGTVLSLEGLTDLAAMRAALAAPVQGLGQAFGASVAGVATSAMLGLMTALARRERAAAGQRLDARIATVLRPLTAAGRQQRIVDALQAQATQLPLLVERMNALADGLVRQGEQLQAGWLAGQQAHHAALERLIGEMNRRTEASVHDLTSRTSASVETLSTRTGAQLEALAGSLQAAVRQHLDDSARALDERQANGLAQTLSTLSRESAAVHERLAAQVGGQVDALAQRLGGATAAIEQRWLDALARHEAQGDAMLGGLREALSGAALAWADRGQALVDALEAREQRRDAALAARTEGLIDGLEARTDRTLSALAGQGEATLSALAQRGEATLSALAAQSETTLRVLSERGAALVQDAGAAQALLAGRVSEELQAVGREVTSVLSRLGAESADLQARQTASMRQLVDTLQQAWGEIDGRQRGLMAHQAAEVERTMAQVVEGFRHEAAALVAAVESAQAQAQAARADGDERRLAAWQAGLETLAASLQSQWQASGEAAAQRQAQAQAQLQATAEALAEDHRQRTRATLDEIATLMQAAAQAPRAAAEVVAGLREQLAASVAQDRALLDERGALLEGVRGLLDAAQAASERQGEAVQALVEASRAMLADTGERFAAQVQATAQQLVEAAAGVSGGIAEVAGLGEVFGEAVQRFGDSNAQLGAQLQRIEAALTQSMNRSDDQMAYYVAQARELIDLSLLSQKRIVDELQRGGTGAAAATATREAPDA